MMLKDIDLQIQLLASLKVAKSILNEFGDETQFHPPKCLYKCNWRF